MKYIFISIILFPATLFSQLKVAFIFSDNMVLQRNNPIHIWGTATPRQQVSVSFNNEHKSVIVKNDSTWSVYLHQQEANSNAQTLLIKSGKDKIEIKNILIGDIWVCTGQSNMEWPLYNEMHFAEEIKNTNQPLIRINNPPPAGRYVYGVAYGDSLNKRLNKKDFYAWGQWQTCDSNSAKSMSAVAYYFAKSIVGNTNIPIGLINLSIGGAPLEAFISTDALKNNKEFSDKVKGNWLYNNALPEWIRERGLQNVGKNTGGFQDELGLNHAYKPGFAFECGVQPILSFPIKGVICYQGESNSLDKPRVEEYKDLMHLLINEYRAKWKQPTMPFYWVQLSSIDTAYYHSQYWPEFRDDQRQLISEVKNGGMAVCSDIGLNNSVHPTNKKDVGERLARWALHDEYNIAITPSGPLPLSAKFLKDKVIITFKYANGLKASNGEVVKGFSIDGEHDAPVIINKNTIEINDAQKPKFVYYGWKPFTDANLVNADNLPASTFKLLVK
ncbi:MAG: sialate O-acetylesterase [Bacteroidetes bacterium]|nr:sialate O-acetylesterase [Bacteroidota bacterium]MBS1757479.1 sialate O-acetylesterase [Bacteroidota bacterium]